MNSGLSNIERLTFTDGSQMLGNTSHDYSGDVKSDILLQHSSGALAIWRVGTFDLFRNQPAT